MASGIAVNDQCIKEYQALSRSRTHRAVILKINDDMSEVVVDSILPKSQGDHEGDWKDFVKLLPESDCRYVVVDFEWKDQVRVVSCSLGGGSGGGRVGRRGVTQCSAGVPHSAYPVYGMAISLAGLLSFGIDWTDNLWQAELWCSTPSALSGGSC